MSNEMQNDNVSFSYSSSERAEALSIRAKYEKVEKEETPIEILRRLDASVTKIPCAISLTVGVIGTLIMGFGMSIAMSELGVLFGELSMVIGIIIGILGIGIGALAYPLYRALLKRQRDKIAPDIIRITDIINGKEE